MDLHVQNLHGQTKDNGVNFICGVCKHEFKEEDNYNKHVKIHDVPTTPVQLTESKTKVVMAEKLLDENEVVDTSKKPTIEEELQYPQTLDEECVNVNPSDVYVEISIENQPKKYGLNSVSSSVICPFCKLESKNLEALKTHIENIHNKYYSKQTNQENYEDITILGNETCFKCPKCEKSGSKGELEKHIRFKHNQLLKCHKCGDKFADIHTLEEHIENKHRTQC